MTTRLLLACNHRRDIATARPLLCYERERQLRLAYDSLVAIALARGSAVSDAKAIASVMRAV